MGTAVSQSQDGISEMWIIPQENRLEQSAHSQLGRTQPLGACDVQPPPLIPAGTETVTYRKYNLCPITNSLRHFSPSKAQDCQCHPSQKTLSFMWLLSSWPCSSGNFHSAFWDMQTMQNFCLLLLHKAPKSFKTPVWDVACLPQPVWPAQSVCSWSHCTGCLFPPRSHSWPIPGAAAVLPGTCSVRRFDILNSYYIQTPFTELVFAEEWIILFDYTVFTSGEMWHSRHQISVSMFCLAIKVPDTIPENLLHLFSNSL